MVQSRRTVPGRLGHKASPPTSEGIASVAFSPSHLRYRQRQRPSPRQSLRISGAHRYGRRQRRRWRRRRTAFRRSSRRSHRRLGTSDRPRAHNTSPPVSDAIAPATFSPSHIRHRQRQHPSPRRSLRISGAHRYRRRQSRRWRRRRTAFRRSSRRSHRRLGTSDRSRGHKASPPASECIASVAFSPSHLRHRQRQRPSLRQSLRISGAHRYRHRQCRR
mmetsp:Transcript_135662/g.433982  ORF Transcript_135662/g.433982 Transcript_135662/m.433982 type:complete len:218 (+) Transcript_135662:48-701(+)